jgi:ribonuclease J
MTTAHPDDELLFLPLGGAGEIGMNLNLLGYGPAHRPRWIMIDCGVTFGDDTTPGIDLIMADPSFIVERQKDLLGLVLTHAHEDHIGAVPFLWPKLRCPIYATPFTAKLVLEKLKEEGLAGTVPLRVIPLGGTIELGPFGIELVTITHSIPEPNALAIRTPLGTVVHTGDWKIDPDPLIGEVTDMLALRRLGDEGVLAMICDSTNVFSPGRAGSEADVRASLTKLIASLRNRVAVTAFASNVARLESVILAAQASDRHVVLVGRAMKRLIEAAQTAGYLKGLPPLLSEDDGGWLPPDKVLYLCTGSQGEPRAALSRIAAGTHPRVVLEAGDTVIFSSRIIPGNERAIAATHNRLVSRGIEVLTERDHFVHVSGHPCRDDLADMYQWIRPRIAVPVHGETRHLIEHEKFARAMQVPETLLAANGTMLRLAPGKAGIVEEVEHGRLIRDGSGLFSDQASALKERRKLAYAGLITATLVIDRQGRLAAQPRVSLVGVPGDGPALSRELSTLAAEIVAREEGRKWADEEFLSEMTRRALRKAALKATGVKPETRVEVIRLPA